MRMQRLPGRLVPAASAAPSSGADPGAPALTQAAPPAAPTAGALPYVAPPAAFDAGLLRIAYFDGAGLQLWTEGGARKLLYSGEPVSSVAISDDGWVIAFTTRNEYYIETGLWRVYADGSGLLKLLDAAALKAFSQDPNADSSSPYQMVFVPASHTLAFNTRVVFMGPGLMVQDDLRLLELDSAQMTTLFAPGQGGMFSFSPDGSKVALMTPTSLSLANGDGTNRQANIVTFPSIITYSEYQFYPNVRWAADGSRLMAAIPSEDPMAADPTMTVWQVDAATGAATQLNTYPSNLSLFFAENVISPDLQKIAYLLQVGPAENNIWELHVAMLDGSQDRALRSGNLRFSAWSTDSKWVTISEDGELLNGDANGHFSALADTLPASDASWVDGGRFLYWSGVTPNLELRLGGFIAPSQAVEVLIHGCVAVCLYGGSGIINQGGEYRYSPP